MADSSSPKKQRSPFAFKVGKLSGKRKNSKELEKDSKRERIGSIEPESTSSANSIEIADSSHGSRGKMAEMTDDEFTNKILKAFSDERVNKLMNGETEKLLKKMDERLDMVEEKVEVVTAMTSSHTSEIEAMKVKMDEYEQRDRNAHAIISGAIEGEITKESLVKLLNEKLEVNIDATDVKYVLKLGRNTGELEYRRARIVFVNEAKRNEMMKQKSKLKDKNLWLSDDLTNMRNNLAFLARTAVKNNKIAETWVTDSKVFVKDKGKAKARRIYKPSDIPN
jgi:hypothetical protein